MRALATFDRALNLDKFTQELRLTSKSDGPFLWQLGGFYHLRACGPKPKTFHPHAINGTPFTGANAILNTLAVLDIPSDLHRGTPASRTPPISSRSFQPRRRSAWLPQRAGLSRRMSPSGILFLSPIRRVAQMRTCSISWSRRNLKSMKPSCSMCASRAVISRADRTLLSPACRPVRWLHDRLKLRRRTEVGIPRS